MAGYFTDPAAAFAEGQKTTQQGIQNWRTNNADAALVAKYGAVAGDPQRAQQTENYLQATKMNPLLVQQQQTTNQGAQNRVNYLAKDYPLLLQQQGLANTSSGLRNQLAAGTLGANITKANTAAASGVTDLATKNAGVARAGMTTMMTTMRDRIAAGESPEQAFDSSLSSVSAATGVPIQQLMALRPQFVKNPAGTTDKLYGTPLPAPDGANVAANKPFTGSLNMDASAQAIKDIESSGGNYAAVGPAVNGPGESTDHAYGAYQVMGANIGPWTKEVLGKALTPAEFVASPAAQDAVFRAKFSQLVAKYGPEGAAQAWFGGPGSVGKVNRSDGGTTVGAYGNRFVQGYANYTGSHPGLHYMSTGAIPGQPGSEAPAPGLGGAAGAGGAPGSTGAVPGGAPGMANSPGAPINPVASTAPEFGQPGLASTVAAANQATLGPLQQAQEGYYTDRGAAAVTKAASTGTGKGAAKSAASSIPDPATMPDSQLRQTFSAVDARAAVSGQIVPQLAHLSELAKSLNGSQFVNAHEAKWGFGVGNSYAQAAESIHHQLSLFDWQNIKAIGISTGRLNETEFKAFAMAYDNLGVAQDPKTIQTNVAEIQRLLPRILGVVATEKDMLGSEMTKRGFSTQPPTLGPNGEVLPPGTGSGAPPPPAMPQPAQPTIHAGKGGYVTTPAQQQPQFIRAKPQGYSDAQLYAEANAALHGLGTQQVPPALISQQLRMWGLDPAILGIK